MTSKKTVRACLVTGVFTAGVAVAAGPQLATAASDAFKDVVVRNTDTNPVPTKAIGTTTVDASGHTLTISGVVDAAGSKVDATGSKVDASGSTVTIQGDPTSGPIPVEVTNQPASGEATSPLSRIFHLFTQNTVGPHFLVAEMQVPATENWTITHVAVHQPDYRNGTAAPVDDVILDALFSEPRGFTAIAGTDKPAFSQDVKMYASAGSNLYIAAGWRNENDPKGLVVVTLTGEKTTVPASTAAARSAKRPDPMSPEALEQLTIQQGSSSQK